MSSKENLKDALKRNIRKLIELRKVNIKLQEQIDVLKLKLKMQKIHCKLFHREGQEFISWIKGQYWKLYYLLKYRNE